MHKFNPLYVADPKTAPIGYFCLVVGNVNINMHLLEKLFMEVIRPNIQLVFSVRHFGDPLPCIFVPI